MTTIPRKFRKQIKKCNPHYLSVNVFYDENCLTDNIMVHMEISHKLFKKISGISLDKNKTVWIHFYIRESAVKELSLDGFGAYTIGKNCKFERLEDLSLSGISKTDIKYIWSLAFEDESFLKTREKKRNDYQKYLD